MFFFAAFQNQNIVFRKWLWVPPGSYSLTLTRGLETSAVAITAVQQDFSMLASMFFAMGTAGWMGSFTAMYIHRNSKHRK